MEFISKIFESQLSFNGMLQVGVDVVMLALLIAVLTGKRSRISKKDEALMESFEQIIEETEEISRRFEINLEKRREMLQQLTAKLDERITQAQNLCAKFERLSSTDPGQSPVNYSPDVVSARPRGIDRRKVLSLAGKGLDAPAIAESLRRPLGEVELVLNLEKAAIC